jgi:hypothetical protein
VNYIRCETRLAIQDKSIALLKIENPSNPIIPELERRRGQPWPPFVKTRLVGHDRLIYEKYIQTGIAYDFSFDITEDNGASGTADPIRLFTNGTAGIGLSASGDFKRENLRHFIVSETAKDLLENPDIPCGPEDAYRSPNFVYPVSGQIGLNELISTFFDLNEINGQTRDGLVANKSVSASGVSSNSTVFADTLTFTTTVMGSVSPHVIVTPTGNKWGLASPASLGLSASRIDKHSLIIGLSLDTTKGTTARTIPAAVVPGTAVGKSALQRRGVSSPTEQSALDAIVQARLDAYLDRAFH